MISSYYHVAILLSIIAFCVQIEPGVAQEEQVTFNDSTYAIFTSGTNIIHWLTAQANCMSWGGNLITIDSKQIDSLLFYLTTSYTCWIGLNDRDNEAGHNASAFIWADGSTSTYRQFDTIANRNGEPDDPNGASDCVGFRYGQYLGSDGWDDRICDANVHCYFCKKSGDSRECDLIYEGSCYRAFEVSGGINWLDAQSSCAVWGGDLTSITTERENNLLYTAISDTVSNCWIGLYERDGDGMYQWVDGTVLNFTNWTGSAPTANNTNNCVQMNTNGAGSWVATDCEGTSNRFICKKSSTNTDTTGGRFGELINGRKNFQELSGNTFFYNSSLTLVCGGEENSNVIQWKYSQQSDLSSNQTLTPSYASTVTGLSWITVNNSQQGYYRCEINSSLSYTIGLYDLSLTTVAVSGSTYTYIVGVDREDVLLLCDPMDSSVTLSTISWTVVSGNSFANPLNIYDDRSDLTVQSTAKNCSTGAVLVTTSLISVKVPEISIGFGSTVSETFSSVNPTVNSIEIPLSTKDITVLINLDGRWNHPDNSNYSNSELTISTFTSQNEGLYKFYIINWDGVEKCAMQLRIYSTMADLTPVREVTFGDSTYGYFTTTQRIPWVESLLNCLIWEGNLVTIESKEIDSILFYLTTSYTCWIGLNDRDNEAGNNASAFVWVGGSNSTYRQFDTIASPNVEPDNTNGASDCVGFRYGQDLGSDGWDDRECYAFVDCYFCQKSGDSRGCDLIYEGSCYRAFEVSGGINWLDAQSSCAVWGGDLTSITTERENNLLYTAISDTVSNCWIGLYERDGDGMYQWVDETVLSYTNWAFNEPNDPTTDDCVEMNPNGNWTNIDCGTSRNWFICETDLTNISPVHIFGELTDRSLNFRSLTENTFLYDSTTLACKGDVNSGAIMWLYSIKADLSSSDVLTATYVSIQTGVSWLAVVNTKQGYYQCCINSTNRYTVGVYNTLTTTVASEGTTYQYIVGIDREDVLLLCNPMDSSHYLDSLSWNILNGGTFSNPLDIFSSSDSLPATNTEIKCLSNLVAILTSYILVYVPEITVTYKSSTTLILNTICPEMNTIQLEIDTEDFSLSGNPIGRWKLPNGTYASSSTIQYPVLILEYFGLYQYYVNKFNGDEVCVIQITIVAEGYSTTNSISLSNLETIQNDSTIVITDDSTLINCIISNPGYSVEWYYRSQLRAVQTDVTTAATFSAETGISTLNVYSNQPGYYSCVINADIVFTFYVADRDTLIEITNFDSPSQQVNYTAGSTNSMLYYSLANIPDSSLRWTADIVANGADTQYSIEYPNPVLLSRVFSDVGAGVHTFNCFYRMSPVTLVGSLQLVIRDTATVSISYAGYYNTFSDATNPMFPSPQQVTIPQETQDVLFTCNLTQCMWKIQLEDRTFTKTMSLYNIPIFDEGNEGTYSLIRIIETQGKNYTTAHVTIQSSIITNPSSGIQPVYIAVPVIILLLLAVLIPLGVLFIFIIWKRRSGSSFKARHLSTHSSPSKSQNNFNSSLKGDNIIEMAVANREFNEQIFTKETNFTEPEKDSATYQNVQEAKSIKALTYQEPAVVVNPRTIPIPLDIYKRHIDKIWQKQESLEDEYTSFGGKDHRYACTHAMNEENRIKNRFKQMYPYDQSRVILSKINEDPNSDYINASHIPGFYVKEKFIAAQAPKENTLEDFWRMIIENNIINIVMVTNLVESGRKKCEIYFPLNVGKKLVIGPYEIILDHEEVRVGYTVRIMSVHCMGNITQLKHFHFTAWPDHDVPTLYEELLLFVSKVHEGLIKTKTPMLVHCSAGVGRTGTFITLYNLLAAIQQCKPFSIYSIVHEMREYRPQMVQTFAQYKFIYLSVLEMLLGNTSIPTEEYIETFKLYMQSENEGYVSVFFQQFSELNYQCEKGFDPVCKDALAECNEKKNPVDNILPSDNNRVVLFSSHWPDDYINATSLDNGEIITTVHPSIGTLRDFHQLIYMMEPSLVVMLCSKKELQLIEQGRSHRVVYWPKDKPIFKEPFILTNNDSEKTPYFIRNAITIKHQIDKCTRSFTQIIANNWDDKEELNLENSVVLIQTILEFKQHYPTSPVIIHCVDGAGKSGVVYTVYRGIRDSTEKGYIDIFHIVKKLRNERMKSVTTLTHFVSCFTLLNEFLMKTQ